MKQVHPDSLILVLDYEYGRRGCDYYTD